MTTRRSRLRVAALSALLALAIAAPATASPETLRRSIGNIFFAPFDLALAPVVAANTVYVNLQEIDDSEAVRFVYPIPGWMWTTGVQIGASVIRVITGLLELLPGLALLPFEADLDPLFDPVERGDALVDIETTPLRIKFGVNYTTVPY